MGTTPSHSKDEIEAEKTRFLQMTPEKKQGFYEGFNAVSLSIIPTWSHYYITNVSDKERIQSKNQRYPPDAALNRKVSLWLGDITYLEIDAIVNSSAKPESGGEVNKAILKQAGTFFVDECLTKGIPEPGQVLVTGGYQMPARYIINTLAPPSRDRPILTDCYRNSLEVARQEDMIRVLAFPCIATRKKHAFKPDEAARVVLTVVREWLQQNHTHVDRVIFCVYRKADLAIYERVLQEFFPVSENELLLRRNVQHLDDRTQGLLGQGRHTTDGVGAMGAVAMDEYDDDDDSEEEAHKSKVDRWSKHIFRSTARRTSPNTIQDTSSQDDSH